MTPEQAKALLEPFPAETIGKLPRITCSACSKAQGRVCADHRKIECPECHNWISQRHIHLDYVGHAAVTKRLLEVDPDWTWEPVAFHPNGAPAAQDGGLWIRLTIAGVTRYGWGDGPDVKQQISDAIRNAAMRFGVALDLWSKEDLRASDENVEAGHGSNGAATPAGGKGDGPTQSAGAVQGSSPSPASTPTESEQPASKNRIQQLQSKLSAMLADGVKGVASERTKRGLPKLDDDCTPEQVEAWAELLNELDPNLARPML